MNLYQYIAEALFFAFILLTFSGGLLAVRSRILMHAVLGLAVSLLGVAGMYFFLGSPFLAMMQILIYVGAVCIMIVFGIMVGYTPTEVATRGIKGKNPVLALGACIAAFLLLLVGLNRSTWVPAAVHRGDFSLAYLGKSLIYQYCLAFELISVVLLTAIIGAIILAQGKEGEHL